MLTLAESVKLSQPPLIQGVMETFVQASVVLDRLPLLTIAGNSYSYNEEATLPGVEFRAVNAAYAESTGTVNQKTEKLVILGGEADVDTFLQATGGALNDLRALQTVGKVKASSYKFQDTFINGDVAVDANAFDGLKKRITGAQIVDAATNGLPVVGTDDAARQTFLDSVDSLLAAVPDAEALYMNTQVLARLRSSLRRLNLAEKTDGFQLGKVSDAYRGVALLDIGNRADGTPIIPQTETQGTSSLASSIYAVRFGRGSVDQATSGLTNGGIRVEDLGKLQSKPAYRTRIEFFCGLALFGGRAAGRLRGVLNS